MQRKNSPRLNRKATPSLTLPPRGGGRGEGDPRSLHSAHHVSRLTLYSSRITSQVYYPAFLNLRGKKAIVVGGGKIAERKAMALLNAGADITVVSPEITKKIAKEKLRGNLKHIPRQYRKGDVKNAFLVIAATDSEEINEKVSKDASCLVNVVDSPSLCNFIVPSVLQRGPLTIAVSTGGISPALSKSIRKELEKLYGYEFAKYLRLLEKIRKKAMAEIQDKEKRAESLKSLASEKMIKMLREKGFREVEKALLSANVLKT
jgi:precorrin-2 dehydrogenase/sirohydrochlorin ferrochelatase